MCDAKSLLDPILSTIYYASFRIVVQIYRWNKTFYYHLSIPSNDKNSNHLVANPIDVKMHNLRNKIFNSKAIFNNKITIETSRYMKISYTYNISYT